MRIFPSDRRSLISRIAALDAVHSCERRHPAELSLEHPFAGCLGPVPQFALLTSPARRWGIAALGTARLHSRVALLCSQ